LIVPCYQQTYGVPWAAFPASLEVAVDAWFADPVDDGDFFADTGRMKPLAPRTIATQKDHLRCTASALVRTGHDPSAIADLAYLVQPAHVRQALTFFLDRHGGKPNAYIAAIAYTLRTVAKYGVALPDEDRKEVERLYKKVAQQRSGMTDRNLTRLRQLDDPAVRDRLLAFPTLRIREVLRSDSGGVAEALAVQAAVAAELWLFVPLRIGNFAGLRLDQHLVRREGGRGERPWAIHVPAALVKNAVDLDYELPAPIARHLELYLERFRPRLVAGTNPWLFPGRDDKAKHVATLRSQVTRAVRQGTGIELHPHLFRHIAGKLLLDEHPGDQGTVQRLLGHKSIRTTAVYTGAETRAAIRRYDEVVLGLRAQALSRAGVAA
jgi:integrase